MEVERNVKIEFNLEKSPLYIKTVNIMTSDSLTVKFFDDKNEEAGGVDISVGAAPQYSLSYCNKGYNDFEDSSILSGLITGGNDVIWTITKTPGQGGKAHRIEIKLNENSIANYNFDISDDCDHDDRNNWNREVKKILFSDWETASDFYKLPPKQCTRLETGWTNSYNMATDLGFPVDEGTTLTVSCTGSYTLLGDNVITCIGDQDFQYDTPPECGEF